MNADAVVRRAFATLGTLMAIANLGGASLVFVYLAIVSPVPGNVSEDLKWRIVRVNLMIFAPYMALTILAVGGYTARRSLRAAAWALAGRAPTPAEVEATLRLPRSVLAGPIAAWTCAAALFAPLQQAFGVSWVLAVRVGTGILLGGAVTATLVYLFAERALRPVAALVLARGVPDRPRAPGILPRLAMSWLLGSALPLLGVGLTQLFRTPGERQHMTGAIWFLVAVGLATGAVALGAAATSVAEPIAALGTAVRQVGAGRLDVRVDIDDASEVGQLQAGFNEMVTGLAERQRLQDLFGRHVGAEVARDALERGIALGGEQRDVSVLFVDLRGSTSYAEHRAPAQVVAMLNRFFAAVVATAAAEGGLVNKFAGDGALCVFGAPADLADHAGAALRAARALRAALDAGDDLLDAAIGVSSGLVVAGNVGAEERFEYTVIGDPVNEAARLTEIAKEHPARLLASERAVAAAPSDERARWRPEGAPVLRGRSAPTPVYAPAG